MRRSVYIGSRHQAARQKAAEHANGVHAAHQRAGQRAGGKAADKHQRKIAPNREHHAERHRNGYAADAPGQRGDHGEHEQQHHRQGKAKRLHIRDGQQQNAKKQADADLFRIRQHVPVAQHPQRAQGALHRQRGKLAQADVDERAQQRRHVAGIKDGQQRRLRQKQQKQLIQFGVFPAPTIPKQMHDIVQHAGAHGRVLRLRLQQYFTEDRAGQRIVRITARYAGGG